MRASVAINLGDTLKRRDSTLYLTRGGTSMCPQGCALGGIPLALGMEGISYGDFIANTWPRVLEVYPWMAEWKNPKWQVHDEYDFEHTISYKFSHIDIGSGTFEELVDWVRSIEPDCDCNRYNCNCSAKAESPKEDMAYAESQDTLTA